MKDWTPRSNQKFTFSFVKITGFFSASYQLCVRKPLSLMPVVIHRVRRGPQNRSTTLRDHFLLFKNVKILNAPHVLQQINGWEHERQVVKENPLILYETSAKPRSQDLPPKFQWDNSKAFVLHHIQGFQV